MNLNDLYETRDPRDAYERDVDNGRAGMNRQSRADVTGEEEPSGVFTVVINGRPWKTGSSNEMFALASRVANKHTDKKVAVKWPTGELNAVKPHGVSEEDDKIDSRFKKTEWMPLLDAIKILKHYGATPEKYMGHDMFPYYDREGNRKYLDDISWNADNSKNVRVSLVNAAVRELKAQQQGMTEGYYDLNDEGMQPIDLSSKPSFKQIVNRYTQLVYQGHAGETSPEEDQEYDAIEQYVAKRFGEKGSAHLQKAGEVSYWGRDDKPHGRDSRISNLGWPSMPSSNFRTTKAGKMHKQDAGSKKHIIGNRLGSHPAPTLPESDVDSDGYSVDHADSGEYDYEGDQAKDQLNTIVRAAQRLNGMLDDNENMPEWVQMKITNAADYIDTAADYIESNQEPELDEAIGQQLNIQQLATISDEALDKAYGYGRSQPGNSFGWQANLKSAAFAKQMIDKGVTDIDAISDAIHKGWNTTAQAFVQNPEQFDDTAKLKAAGKLEAKLQQRAQLMKQNYGQLPEEEKEKDRVVARALLQALKGEQGVAEGSRNAYLKHNNLVDIEKPLAGLKSEFDKFLQTHDPEEKQKYQQGIKQRIKTRTMAGPQGQLPEQGVAEGEKVGNMDADRFDAALARMKQLAGSGPLKTVWDPDKRVYRNIPVAVQPKK